MTSQAGAVSGTAEDTQVVLGLFLGSLGRASPVGTKPDGTPLLIKDHPGYARYAKLADLARAPEQILAAADAPNAQTAWSGQLSAAARPATLLLRLHVAKSSGILVVRDGAVLRAAALWSGWITNLSSNVAEERLATVLGKSGKLTAEEAQTSDTRAGAVAVADWVCAGKFTVEDLVSWHLSQANRRLISLLAMRRGDVIFINDPTTSQIAPAFSREWWPLLRRCVSAPLGSTPEQVREKLSGFFKESIVVKAGAASAEILAGLPPEEQTLFAALQRSAQSVPDLLAALGANDAEAQAASLRTLYLLSQVGLVSAQDAQANPATTGAVSAPAAGATPVSGEAALAEYHLQQQLEAEGKKLLMSFHAADAVERLAQLAARQPQRSDAHSWYAVALSLRGAEGDAAAAVTEAQKALSLDHENPAAHAAMCRALEAAGRHIEAAEERVKAKDLVSASTPEWQKEVRQLLTITATPVVAKRKVEGIVGAVGPWALCLGPLVILAVLGAVVGLGRTELYYNPTDFFFYGRRVLLLICGIGGIALITGSGPVGVLSEMGWSPSVKVALVGILWGIPVGILSPKLALHTPIGIVVAMTIFHVLCEEIFFRGFALRLLLDKIGNWQTAAVLGSVLYGLYHLTYWAAWAYMGPSVRMYWVAAITFAAGLPYTLAYVKSRSLVPPILCHLCVNGTMLVLSLIGK